MNGPGVVDWGPGGAVPKVPSPHALAATVDQGQLYKDVKEMIFRDCRNTTMWDHLGNLEEVVEPQIRRVTIDPQPPKIVEDRIQFIQLPVGLGLLFDVATSDEFEDLERRDNRQWYGGEPSSPGSPFGLGLSAMGLRPNKQARFSSGGSGPHSKQSSRSPSTGNTPGPAEKPESHKEEKSTDQTETPKEEEKPEALAESKERTSEEKPEPNAAEPAKQENNEFSENFEISVAALNDRIRLCGPPNHLVYLLTLLALPPEPNHPCVRMYQMGMDRITRLKAEDEARKKAAFEAEWKECTFKPVISAHAKQATGKGTKGDQFFQAAMTWKDSRKKKLEKKIEKDERDFIEEVMQPWQMTKRSVKLAERKKKRDLALGLDCSVARGGIKKDDSADFYSPSFTPMTNHSHVRLLLQASNTPAASRSHSALLEGTPHEQRGDVAGSFTTTGTPRPGVGLLADASVAVLRDGATSTGTPAQFVSRMTEDNEARKKRKEERMERYRMKQKERLFDRITGQPLFVPNAMPSFERPDGTRVPYNKMTAAEKKEFDRRLKDHRASVQTAVCKNKSAKKMDNDHLNKLVENMMEKHRSSKMKIAKINRQEDQALNKLFKPTIEKKSHELATTSEERVPIWSMPLRRPEQKAPSPPKIRPSCPHRMENVVIRSENFSREKEANLNWQRKVKEESHDEELTFHPCTNPESKRLVANAERRLAAELASFGDDPFGAASGSRNRAGPVYEAADALQIPLRPAQLGSRAGGAVPAAVIGLGSARAGVEAGTSTSGALKRRHIDASALVDEVLGDLGLSSPIGSARPKPPSYTAPKPSTAQVIHSLERHVSPPRPPPSSAGSAPPTLARYSASPTAAVDELIESWSALERQSRQALFELSR